MPSGGRSNRRPDFGEVRSLNAAATAAAVAAADSWDDGMAGGVTTRLAMLPASSAAGLILPDVGRASHGNPDIESLLDRVVGGEASSFAFLLDFGPQKNAAVGVVAPKATVEVTMGGGDFPVASRGRWGHDSEGESDDHEYRALLRPDDDDGDGDGGPCVFCGGWCCSLLDDGKLAEDIRRDVSSRNTSHLGRTQTAEDPWKL